MTMATVAKLPGHDQYERVRKVLQGGNRSQIDKALEQLVKSCQATTVATNAGGEKLKIDDDQVNFWLNDVLRLLFDWENALTRDLALKAAEAVFPHLEQTLYAECPAWPGLRQQISSTYSNLLEQARGRNDPEWHRKWAVMVRILDREICQGAVIINAYLAIVESGFRSAELQVREQSFDCWKLLTFIFAKYKQINIEKRVKLICIPLKSSKSKTEMIARKKFEIWWFMVNQLAELDRFAESVFEPFIYFCFGPSFKTPLCYYFDDSYQEFGTPGKFYDSIKQLSAVALIHMLGPADPALTETLLQGCADSFRLPSSSNGGNGGEPIPASLFEKKVKLLFNSCLECTVLLAQMKGKPHLELNRNLWRNLLARVDQVASVKRPEMLAWMQENLAALLKLSVLRKDETMREIAADTVRMVAAESSLMAVTVGQDSPEQLGSNYRTMMQLMFGSEFEFSDDTCRTILGHWFDLRRYTTSTVNPRAYWDALQKTVQYLCDLEPRLLADPRAPVYRRMVTHVYRSMVPVLKEQLAKASRDQLAIALGFLLYPLEYDRFLVVEEVRADWEAVYGEVVAAGGGRMACGFSEMVKAMTVAKYNANLGVILEFFRVVMELVPGDFEMAAPPVKTLELFKDLVRKALVFKNSLVEVAKGVAAFRRLVERMSNKGLLVVIMPVRNVVCELVGGESETLAEEVRMTLRLLADRFVTAKFVADLRGQPKEVKWNCKMLVGVLLEAPAAMQKQWKVTELRKLVDICEGKDTPAKAGKGGAAKKDEYVVINKVWNFTPDKLTEHQRDRMREKRDDIPALYNDMSQSQDSFVIKPWTPNKVAQPVTSVEASSTALNGEAQQEASIPKEEGSTGVAAEKIDKENNNGNVPNGEDEKEPETSGTNGKKAPVDKRSRVARELDRLKIDAIDGQNLPTGRQARSRRSESLEPSGPPKRRKAAEPNKLTLSAKTDTKNRRSTRKSEKIEPKPALVEEPTQETSPKKDRPKSPAERTSPRKSLNFDNVVVDREPAAATEAPSTSSSPIKARAANESIDEVIESSQSIPITKRKFTPRKLEPVIAAETPPQLDEEPALQSPSKNTRSAAQKIAEMETEPNTVEIPETQPSVEVKPAKSPKKEEMISPTTRATRSPRKEPEVVPVEVKKSVSPARAAKSPKKEKRSVSPVPEAMEVVPESPEKPKEEAALVSPNLSPIRDNLDEKMEPLTKALNRSLVASPDGDGQDEREADLLNSTLNISPIPEEKAQPSTPSGSTAAPASGSSEKRASSRIMDREKVAPSPTVTRRTRQSPPGIPAAVANLKARAATTPQMSPRSPSTNRIELRGRGAQLINLIRNQQNEASSPKPSTPVPNTSTPKQSTPSDRSLMLRKLATTSAAAATTNSAAASPEQPKPLADKDKEKDYLVFSKVLPSPLASPATGSILKRKFNHDDSGDDESPANKRKRVSFHDPPVSLTKEYIRQEEELGRSPSIIRCLQMTGGASSPSDKTKFLLRRKSKADSLSELAKFTKVETEPTAEEGPKDDDEEIGSSPESLEGEDFVINTTDQMEVLQVTTTGAEPDVDDVEMKEDPLPEPTPAELPKRTSPRKISPKPSPTEPTAASPKKPASPTPTTPVAPTPAPDTSIRFPTEEDVLAHVVSTYTLDQLLERYLAAGKTLSQPKTARLLTRELSTLMSKDAKTKHTVLDELSERHSAEFLDHAVQENSSAMVCARLSLTTMTEFVLEALGKLPQEEGVKEDDEERVRILRTMFDQLARMTGVAVTELREKFVRDAVKGKSRVEIMELLEEYFGGSGKKVDGASSST